MATEEPRVGQVGDAVELLRAAGEHEGVTGGAAQGAVHGQRDAHVHHVPEGVPDQGVRSVHRPREALSLRLGEEDVLLVVVEVGHRQSLLGLPERRVGGLGCVRVERAEVVLEPGDERDVLERGCPAGGSEQVGQHGAVDPLVLGLRLLPRPGREDDVAESWPCSARSSDSGSMRRPGPAPHRGCRSGGNGTAREPASRRLTWLVRCCSPQCR